MADQPKPFLERILKRVLASRFLTISALLHLLLVVLFGGKVLFNKYAEPPDFESAGGDFVQSTDTSPAPPPANPADTLPPAPSVNTAPPPPAPAAAMTAITSMSTAPAAFSMPLPTLAPPTITKDLAPQAQPQQQNFGSGSLPALPSSMQSRGGSGRGTTGMQYGEKPTSEAAVLKALRWLQSKQQTDGSWGGKGGEGPAMTGLALLCFLGHGETPATSREFGLVVTNAIKFLTDLGSQYQGRLTGHGNFDGQPDAYQHAICTYALCEAYTMTKDEKLVPVIKQAVDYILKGQLPSGGWVYSYKPGKDAADLDSSVTGWQVQALKAAHLTGIAGMEEVHGALDHAIRGLDSLFNTKDGSYGYHHAGDRPFNLTGVGVLCKLFWLGRADRSVQESIKEIKSKELRYESSDAEKDNANLYAWYYDTQACFQAQGGAWEWWNRRFQDQLLNKQNGDGSWPPTGAKEDWGGGGQHNTDQWAIYRTTLCTLMLEVFYRYLPTTKESSMGGGNVQGL